jgi:zinc transport system substrate-binding protein
MRTRPWHNLIALSALAFCLGCSKTDTAAETKPDKITVAASSYVPYDFASSILGEYANVIMIAPPTAHIHNFELSFKERADIEKADLFVYIGGQAEPWTEKLQKNKSVELSRFAENKTDGHIWLDFTNAEQMAEGLAAAIAKKYHYMKPVLLKNLLDFKNELNTLRRLYKKGLSRCAVRKIFHIGHNAFGLIATNYDLQFVAITGSGAEAEPRARDLAKIIKDIKLSGAKYIFTEDGANAKLADTVSKETGTEVLKLNTLEFITKEQFDKKISYREFKLENLKNLMKGLNCAQ